MRRLLSTSAVAQSHIGARPVLLPPNVTLAPPSLPADPFARLPRHLMVTGSLGTVRVPVAPPVSIVANQHGALDLAVTEPQSRQERAAWGLTRSLLANAVKGVSDGFTLSVRLVGVGYRAALEDGPGSQRSLNLKVGLAHPVMLEVPADVQASCPAPTVIELKGIDKQRLGQFAAQIRRWRPPEPYKVRVPLAA